MSQLNLSEITRKRIAKWMDTTKPVNDQPQWTERRQAIVFGGHTYLVNHGQVFQCGHCGHYDPEWNVTEVLHWFKETLGITPIEIDVVCSVAVVEEN